MTALIRQIPDRAAFARALFPNAPHQRHQGTLRTGDVYGNAGQSMVVWLESGNWYDHNGGDSGDLLDVISLRYGIEPRGLRDWLKSHGWLDPNAEPTAPPRPPAPTFRELDAAPADTPMPRADALNRALGFPADSPITFYPYQRRDGRLALLVARIQPAQGRKAPRRLSWNGHAWRVGGTAGARVPLYRLQDVISRPDADVLVVEGEKAADAGAALFPDYAVVCPLGGSNPAPGSDWSPLTGRRVIALGDHDDAGRRFAQKVGAANNDHAAAVMIRDPRRQYTALGGVGEPPKGWDIADPVTDNRGSDQ